MSEQHLFYLSLKHPKRHQIMVQNLDQKYKALSNQKLLILSPLRQNINTGLNNTLWSYNIQMDKLVCLLCCHPYKEPKMCSNCSEIYCSKCIKQYVQHHHMCPKCHNILPQLADCTRLIAQVKNHVKTPSIKKYKNCRVHDLPLKYQCMDCQTSICADCGMIQQKHRGHQIQPKENIKRGIPKAKLREYLLSIEQSILKDHSSHQQLILERQVVRSELRWCRNKLREYYEEISSKLQAQAQKILKEISSDLQQKQVKLSRLKKIKEDIKQIIDINQHAEGSLLQKINPDNQILQQLQNEDNDQLFTKLYSMIEEQDQTNFFNINRKSLTLLNEVYPQYINHTYEFDYESNQFFNVKYSDSFRIYGQQWRLKIYPKGNSQAPNHLSLFLELIDEPNPITGTTNKLQHYYFRLQLISLNAAGQTITKEYRSPFVKGDCWGYNDFVDLSDLREYLNNGHLIFVVGIRNCSYYDVCDNMKRYIKKIQREKKVLEDLLSGRSIQSSLLQQISLESSRLSLLGSQISEVIRLD